MQVGHSLVCLPHAAPCHHPQSYTIPLQQTYASILPDLRQSSGASDCSAIIANALKAGGHLGEAANDEAVASHLQNLDYSHLAGAAKEPLPAQGPRTVTITKPEGGYLVSQILNTTNPSFLTPSHHSPGVDGENGW